MTAVEQPLRLRDRKKIKTREAIRNAAMHLVERNGLAKTTVEQIADAAEVSVSTLFRYFTSKESVLMCEEIEQVAIDALASQPAEVPTFQAFRRALTIVWNTLSDDRWESERRRRRLVYSIPELREMQLDMHRRTAEKMAEAECRRLGRDPDDFEIRVLFNALAGALLTPLSSSHDNPEGLFRALDFVEAGMPLRRQ